MRNGGIEATIHMDPIVTDDARVNELRTRTQEAVRAVDPTLDIHDFRFVEGETHSNLIFDVRVPFELKLSDRDLRDRIDNEISRIDPSFFTVITLDRG